MTAAKAVRRVCRNCRRRTTSVVNHICDRCDEGGYCWCSICGEVRDNEWSGCRHVYYTYSFFGAGVGEPKDGGRGDEDAAPLSIALDVLARVERADWLPSWREEPAGLTLVDVIRREVKADRLTTFAHGPLLGGCSMAFKSWSPAGHPTTVADVSSDVIERLLGDEDDEDDFKDSFAWLTSLQAQETTHANRYTVRMIDRWRRACRKGAVT